LRSARAKKRNDITEKYHAAVYPEPAEGQAISHIEAEKSIYEHVMLRLAKI
jgi:hypothetical protein